jgi:ABC-type oligopeptide transport system ATPase subunit
MMTQLKVINLFGAPGSGKSTAAAGLFNLMKVTGKSVELVTEAAKDWTWSKDWMHLKHQPSILAEQDFRLARLEGQVEWAITDSPLPAQIAYMGTEWQRIGLDDTAYNLWDRYINFSVLLTKGDFEYQKAGRNETSEQAMVLANVMDHIFVEATEDFPELSLETTSTELTAHQIYNWIFNHHQGGST